MIKLINKLTGSVMWVAEERKDEYLAAGHRLAAICAKPANVIKKEPEPKAIAHEEPKAPDPEPEAPIKEEPKKVAPTKSVKTSKKSASKKKK